MNRKSLIACALMAAGILSQAGADQVVYVTGSTAFRSTAYNALNTAGIIFDGAVTRVATRGGSSPSGANFMLFHGNINTTPTYINCAWSGANAGIASVCNVAIDNDGIPLFGAPETWLKADGTVTGDVVAQPTASELEASSRQGDIAFGDTSQASSLPPTQFKANTSTALKDYGVLGVICFTWLKNNNSASVASVAKTAWNNLTNVSTYQLNALIANGAVEADFLTSSINDSSNFVYLVGRNKGSGTRANMLDDTQYGLNVPVNQFSIGGNLTGTPDGTLTLASCGDNGYESGGAVTTALGVAGSTAVVDPFTGTNGWIAIGYASVSDAQKNGVTTANWLTENGVLSSDGAIESGTYSYWGHEHLFGRSNIAGSFADTVGGKITSGVQGQLSTVGGTASAHDAGIGFGFMNCDKATDFSFPTHN
jgi:hypothetical protein